MKTKSSQLGTAIFMALLITAIVASITVVLMRVQQLDIRRTQMMVTSEQTYQYAQGALSWAVETLQKEAKNPLLFPAWPITLSLPIAGGQGKITGTLADAEGLFNLNNLALTTNKDGTASSAISDPQLAASKTTFMNLLTVLGAQLPTDKQASLVDAIIDWNSASRPSTGNTIANVDPLYAQRKPSYRSPHALMTSISELRLVAGMTAKLYNQLAPYVVTLPVSNTTINAKHAPAPIIKALGIQTQSHQQGAASSTPSQYFLLHADVYLSDQHLVLYALLQRHLDPKTSITLLWQSFGTP